MGWVERGLGLQLPEEKYCLTGVGWNLRGEWESEEGEFEDGEDEEERAAVKLNGDGDVGMGVVEGEGEEEDGAGRMEDVFGEEGGGEDTEMS